MDVSGPSNHKRKREEQEEADDDEERHDGFMDDDDEPHRFGSSVLPVANLPASFDGDPQDGLEYLFTVRREERRLPLVTRVHNPYLVNDTTWPKGEAKGQSFGTAGALNVLPSEEWRTCFEERFRNLRANIQQPIIHVALPSPEISATLKIPEMRERDRWWAFFRGDSDWEDVPSSQYHTKKYGTSQRRKTGTVEYDEELPTQRNKMRGWVVYEEKLSWDHTDGDGVVKLAYGGVEGGISSKVNEDADAEEGELSDDELALRKGKGKEVTAETSLPTPRGSPPTAANLEAASPEWPSPREPTPKLLCALPQKTTFHLLKYFTQWIQGHFDRSFLPAPPPLSGLYIQTRNQEKQLYNLTPSHARWIFALLSRLDAQLTSDEISVLRKLARAIITVIKEERSAKEEKGLSRDSSARSFVGETACWMVVAAVTGVWGQKDLWMDAEEALR